MPHVKNIMIIRGHSDGTLTLAPRGRATAHRKDHINWSILKCSNVQSIEDIVMKSGTDIFRTAPHANGNVWSAEVNYNAPNYAEYEYDICWKGKDGISRSCDPKIAIMPSTGHNLLKTIVIMIATCLGLLSLRAMTKK